MTRNEELHKIIRENRLGRRDVARLIGSPISPNGQCYALANWLSAPQASSYRQIPTAALMLLKLRVEALTERERAALEGPTDKVAIIAANRLLRKCHAPDYVYAAARRTPKKNAEASFLGGVPLAS